MHHCDTDRLRLIAEPEGAFVEVWRPKALARISGDAYGLLGNPDQVVVELVVAIAILINADGICPRRQIGFNAQLLPLGNGEKSPADRLRALARKSVP